MFFIKSFLFYALKKINLEDIHSQNAKGWQQTITSIIILFYHFFLNINFKGSIVQSQQQQQQQTPSQEKALDELNRKIREKTTKKHSDNENFHEELYHCIENYWIELAKSKKAEENFQISQS